MIIHTIISPEEIFFSEQKRDTKKAEPFSTDPYFYLDKDEFYKKYVQKRD